MTKKPSLAFILLVLVVFVVFGLILSANVHPRMGSDNACINNLRFIDGATEQWALENRKGTNDAPTWEDLRVYLSHGQIPTCPQGGTYTLGRLGKPPTCSYPGHVLPPDTESACFRHPDE